MSIKVRLKRPIFEGEAPQTAVQPTGQPAAQAAPQTQVTTQPTAQPATQPTAQTTPQTQATTQGQQTQGQPQPVAQGQAQPTTQGQQTGGQAAPAQNQNNEIAKLGENTLALYRQIIDAIKQQCSGDAIIKTIPLLKTANGDKNSPYNAEASAVSSAVSQLAGIKIETLENVKPAIEAFQNILQSISKFTLKVDETLKQQNNGGQQPQTQPTAQAQPTNQPQA